MSDITSTASDTKPWYQSKTIVASLIAVGGVLARLLGHEITETDQAALVDIVTTLATVGGSLFAIYGRVVAGVSIGSPAK